MEDYVPDPTCERCNVRLRLVPPHARIQQWECPVCGKDSEDRYRHMAPGAPPIVPDEAIPLLKFLYQGKEN